MRKSWPEERQEIAMWLSGYLSMYKKWVDRILDNDDHDVTKNKIIDLLLLRFLALWKMYNEFGA